jgi:hypothetical protein
MEIGPVEVARGGQKLPVPDIEASTSVSYHKASFTAGRRSVSARIASIGIFAIAHAVSACTP